MKFIVAEKSTPQGVLLTITDEAAIGTIYREGKRQLDLHNHFYQGKALHEDEIKLRIEDAYILHFNGHLAVKFGIELGLINPRKVIAIQGIKHAQVIIDRT